MTVLRANEIELNSKRFKINGLVRPSLASIWPQKLVVGDFTKADELVASSWVISDSRGGLLIEEMDESIHSDRFYWSTCCTDYRGHIILPALATEVSFITPSYSVLNPSFEDWTAGEPDNWTVTTNIAAISDETSDVHHGSHSVKATGTHPTSGGYVYLDQNFTNPTEWIGLKITLTGWSKRTSNAQGVLKLFRNDVEVGTANCGGDAWGQGSITYVVPVGTTSLKIRFQTGTYLTSGKYVLFDLVELSYVAAGTPITFINFNSKLYVALGKVLAKLNAAGDEFIGVYTFANNITDLIRSVGSSLYIFLGDSANYWYMSTAEAFTETDVQDANKGIHWDSKLFKVNTTGQLAYAATPNSATPSWTNNGNLADEGLVANDIQELTIYRDANANPIIYAGTKIGLYAHDYTNAKWIQTELSLPNHPTCGAGIAWWRDALYLSAGLNVYEYIAGTIAYIASMGLDTNDGLPNKYTGEIAKLTEGYDNFFALVDASLTTGTGYSSVFVYNGGAWRCRWVDATADQAMRCGTISSEFAYRYWWAIASKIYYIGLERSLRNPLKISTYPYAASAVHITPRFDAATPWNKTALRLKAICDKMDAGNEEIVVKYRINAKCYEGIDTAGTWTTLTTLDTDGETSVDFGSSAGILFKVIQFRFDLARGSTTTKTPDLQRVTLVYERTTPAAWAWNVEIDLTQPYRGQTPEQMWQNLKAIITGGVLVPFIFTHQDGSAETNYVEIRGLEGVASTGEEKVGTYSLRLVAP